MKTSLEKKSATRAEAVSRQKNFRARATQCWQERNELVLDIIEAVRRGENLLLNLEPKEYVLSIFEGVSESFGFRVALQCRQLTHIPRKQLAAINEGKRVILAEAFRDLGASKAKDLIADALDSKIEVKAFNGMVKDRRFHPDQHREPLVTISARVEAPIEEKWLCMMNIVSQALTGEDGATPTPSAIYEAVADGILQLTMPSLKSFLPAAEEVEEVAS